MRNTEAAGGEKFNNSYLRHLSAIGSLMLAAACSNGEGSTVVPPPPPPITSVAIVPASANVAIGATYSLAASVVASAGTATTVVWSTADAGIATVNLNGLVTGVGLGTTVITATSTASPTIRGTATITVSVPPVSTVTISGPPGSLGVGAQLQLAATARDAIGTALSGRPVIWSSSSPEVATVSATGLVAGITNGIVNISATSEGKVGVYVVNVYGLAFGPGVRIIGATEMPAGRYRSINTGTTSCYWERLSGFGGTFAEVLANEHPQGPALVDIAATDRGFNSTGCATWLQAAGEITASLTDSFNAGSYLVGLDIGPGTWRADSASSSCFWERDRSFTGTLADVIASGIGPNPSTVTIAPGDVGFRSSRCGAWVKVG